MIDQPVPGLDEVLRRQRMIRAPYADRPVPRDLVRQILLDSRRAPSAGHSQGASFLVLEGDQTREFFELTHPNREDPESLQPCPVVVLPLEHPQAYLDRYSAPDKVQFGMGTDVGAWPVPYWTVDTAMAAMVVLLSATAHGLGGWFFAIFEGEAEVLRRAGVPEGMRPIGAIALGWPRDGAPTPGSRYPRRSDEDVIRWGQW
ncbi:MAG TPA: nitroreductase family protein [Mycobacteriales bacterium]|nr:nitroreductase family protein [Mycobacteriales bacterium]